MKDLTLYVPTCDRYRHLIKPYAFLFNKFWNRPQKVVYLGYEKPTHELPDNFDFVTVGNSDRLDNWSRDLNNFFNSIDDEHIMISTDDSMLVDYTNFERYDKLSKFLENPKVGRINLTRDTVNRPHRGFDEVDGLKIIEARQDASYRLSLLGPCIWRKVYWLKYLKPRLTPWEFEGEGGEVGINDGYHILATKGDGPPDDAPVFSTNTIWRSTMDRFNFHNSNYAWKNNGDNYMDPNVVKEMYEKKIIDNNIRCGYVKDKKWHFPYDGI